MATVKICDYCLNEMQDRRISVQNEVRGGPRNFVQEYESLDFCSYNCLADWSIAREEETLSKNNKGFIDKVFQR